MENVKQTLYNQETLDAFLEARDILSGKREAKSYSCVKELFDEIEAECQAEQRQPETSG